MVQLTAIKIVGSASPLLWSQAQTVSRGEAGQVMVVLQLQLRESESIVDLATLGTELLQEIEKESKLASEIGDFKQRMQSICEGVASGVRVGMMVGVTQADTLWIYGYGEVEAYLARGGKLAKLKDVWDGGETILGSLIERDVIVLSTAKFVATTGLTKFKAIVVDEQDPAELLAPLVHTQADSSGIAAVVGEVKSGEHPSLMNFWHSMTKADMKIKLRSEEPRKINLWIGAGVFLLLILMIGIGMVRRTRVVAERDFATLSTSVQSKMEETRNIGDLNPERARVLLSQARNEVESYLATNVSATYKLQAQKLNEMIEATDEQTFKKNEIRLETIVELPILVDGLQATKMKSDGKGNLLFLDTKSSRVISMNLVDRSRQVFTMNKDVASVDIGVFESVFYGLSKLGVDETKMKNSDTKRVIEPDEFWQEPAIVQVFAGNIYILDVGQSEIWKYPTLGDSFGARRRWLAAGISLDLSNVIDMKVVGDVWLLTSTGKLERYSRGAPAPFTMEGFPAKDEGKKLSQPSALFVTDSLVYVLENGSSRILVFGIDGKYQSQYTNPEFAKASDLVVVDDKAYVLVENAVKAFGL